MSTFTINHYGATWSQQPDGSWTQTLACNVQDGSGEACSLDEGHDGKHSWELPRPLVFGCLR